MHIIYKNNELVLLTWLTQFFLFDVEGSNVRSGYLESCFGEQYLCAMPHSLAYFDRAIVLIRQWLTALCLNWLALAKNSIIQTHSV